MKPNSVNAQTLSVQLQIIAVKSQTHVSKQVHFNPVQQMNNLMEHKTQLFFFQQLSSYPRNGWQLAGSVL